MGYRYTLKGASKYPTIERFLNTWSEYDYPTPHIQTLETISMGHILATGGAGASAEFEELSAETVADIAKTEATLVLASDTNDNAYDTETVTVHYKTAAGVKKDCIATYDPTASTTEVAFKDLPTGLIAVTDFYCFNTKDYGVGAVQSSVAVQAGDNVCVGVTGLVAGIADPDICFCKILAAATQPTLANMFGVGCVYLRTKTNQADAGYIDTVDYITAWGELCHATGTIAADGTTEVRLYDTTLTTIPVLDFYRRVEILADHATLDEHLLCNDDDTVVYGVIKVGHAQSEHSRHYVKNASRYTFFAGADFDYQCAGAAGEYCVVTITLTPKGAAAISLAITVLKGEHLHYQPEIPLAPNTQVTLAVADDSAAGGNLIGQFDLVEALNI